MAERSALTQASQIGAETTIGTGVPAGKLPQAIGYRVSPHIEVDGFRPEGQKVLSEASVMQDFTDIGAEGRGSYSELAYIFNSALADVTPTTTDTSAKNWTYTPSARAEDNVRSYSIEAGGSVRAHKAYGCVFTGFEITFNRRTPVTVTAEGFGREFQDNATLTPTPTAIEAQQILPKQVSVWLDATGAALGTNKLLRDFNVTWRCSGLRAPIWPLDDTKPSWAAIVETEPTFEVEVSLEADAAGMALIGDVRAGLTKFLRIKATSTNLAGAATVFYSLTADLAGKITDVGTFDEDDGVYTINYTMSAAFDATWGKFMNVVLVNKVASL